MRIISGRLIIGLAVLVLGVLMLINNLVDDVQIRFSDIMRYWPVIPLILGLNWLVLSFRSYDMAGQRRMHFSWGQFVTALVMIAIGTVYLGNNLGLTSVDTSVFWNLVWPAILILIGINLIRGRSQAGESGGRFTFMGGANVGGAQPWKLESGSYFAFMGGIEMDLTVAELDEGETVLDLTAVMGGIEVKIPKDMAVRYEGSAVLGGVTFKDQEDGGIIASRKYETILDDQVGKILFIQARAILGGIEIKEA